MDQDSTAPSPETLRKLRESLPSMAQGLREKRIGGKGKPVPIPMFTKVCAICGTAFCKEVRDKPVEFRDLKLNENCEDCQEHLNRGETALVAGNDYAFIKFAEEKHQYDNLRGKVVQMSVLQMHEIKKWDQLEWKVKETLKDAPTSPENPA